MLFRQNDNMSQVFFAVFESELTAKISLPGYWQQARLMSPDQLIACADRAVTRNQRLFIVVDEKDYSKIQRLLSQLEASPIFGLMAISRNVRDFLKQPFLGREFLDVITEKDAKKDLEHFVVRAVKHLDLIPQEKNHIGPETLRKLNETFIALSAQRNPERLLITILNKACELTRAEGGSLFVVEEKDGEMHLKLEVSSNGSEEKITAPAVRAVENSFCGYVALTGKMHNVHDLTQYRSSAIPQFNKSFDCNVIDPIKSIIIAPLKNSRNEVVAVLQLVNRWHGTNSEQGFDASDESVLTAFCTQAAICIETADLYGDVQRLFEGFVKASITAIESRDPSTGGHSERVARMSVALARATSETAIGIYRSVRFKDEEMRELEYAALLHDFGKIGVREEVLVKAKKLYDHQLDSIRERIRICLAAAKIEYLERKIERPGDQAVLEKEYLARIQKIESYWPIIDAANAPTILKQENVEVLDQIRSEQLILPDGSKVSVLTDEEYLALSVSQGSLTESERLEIESHVRHTYQFLKMIPWTRDFRHLTEIAYCHHEKLDGSGYPRNLMSHEIPLQSKIMTISDIFDALTAADRWYKEAVPVQKALEILAQEVGEGKLDPVLYELFVEKKVYEVAHPKVMVA